MTARSGSSLGEEFKYEFKWFKDDFDTDPKTRGRLFKNRSRIEEERAAWEPPIPKIFESSSIACTPAMERMQVDTQVAAKWPELADMDTPCILEEGIMDSSGIAPVVGIILTGEWVPSSGTHNVIMGVVRFLFERFENPRVLGFLGGPQGFARKHFVELTPALAGKYLNQGGADFLGFGSLRAIDETDFGEIHSLCRGYGLTSLIFVGGPNELAHVSQLIQMSRKINNCDTTIVGVFQSPNSNVFVKDWIPVTLGYDSARCALSEYVGNIAIDGLSSGRAVDVNFIRCGSTTMTMEIALHVEPAMTVVADEIRAKKLTIQDVISRIVAKLKSRIEDGIRTATILISDKFYQSLTGFATLQSECRVLYVKKPALVSPTGENTVNPELYASLTSESRILLQTFPVSEQLRIVRAYDSDGNATWPDIEPERYIARLTAEAVKATLSIHPVMRTHFIGQEGRCPFPTNFDCSLGIALGYTAGALALNPECHGYIAAVKNLTRHPSEWICGGIPLAPLLRVPKPPTDILADQFGGANQELINLARQRVERESSVPRIVLRPQDIEDDVLYRHYLARQDNQSSIRQPGPYQFNQPWTSESLCIALRVAAGEPENVSWLQKSRLEYIAKLPACCESPELGLEDSQVTTHRSAIQMIELAFPLTNSVSAVTLTEATHTRSKWIIGEQSSSNVGDETPLSTPRISPSLAGLRLSSLDNPLRIGIVFLGRHSAGCHNVIWGIWEYLKRRGNCIDEHSLIGFVHGSTGLITGDHIELTQDLVMKHRNQSGIDLLGRSENPISTRQELIACVRSCKKLRLDGLVVVGGLGTHADTALLAELVAAQNIPTKIIGVPASVENDIPLVEQTLGHDTACRVYSSIIGSLATLAASSKRQWCFVRISGRSLSHIITEVALQTHPNLILIAEELTARRMSLADIVDLISDLISERAKDGFDFGIVVFSESVLERVEEISRFSSEIESISKSKILNELSPMSAALFEVLPERAKHHVLHSNHHHSVRIVEPELLLERLVGKELQRRRMFSPVRGSFRSSTHTLAQQGRSSLPSDLDCDLGFTMGFTAAALVAHNRTGLLVNVTNLAAPVSAWVPMGIPLTSLLDVTFDAKKSECLISIEQRKPGFILDQLPPPSKRRFVNPGPLQFGVPVIPLQGLSSMSSRCSREAGMVKRVSELCSKIMSMGANAGDENVRDIIQTGLQHTLKLLASRSHKKSTAASASDTRDRNGELLRPFHKSHSRVVKIVPVT